MSGFRTKLDFSDNRQAKQRPITRTVLSGGTSFGLPFNLLPSGPNLSITGLTNNYTYIASTFSGDNTTTVYNWSDPRMQLGISSLSAITSITSGLTQNTGVVWTANTTTIIDGNTVALTYSGVSFDISVVTITNLTPTTYSGTITTNNLDIYSASTLDYTGRTIWVDVSGITRTEKLIITKNPQVGYTWTCVDLEGNGEWQYNGSSSGSTIWTAGTGANSAVLGGSNGIASGSTSVAEGVNTRAGGIASHAEGGGTQALGDLSHSEGEDTIASNTAAHAEGVNTLASGTYSHAEGSNTIASGARSHAEGYFSIASGDTAHAEGNATLAGGSQSHAEGQNTIASGTRSHAEGYNSIASGDTSHAEGNGTLASGDYSHAEGFTDTWGVTEARGLGSHAEGNGTLASGDYSHAEGQRTIASGLGSHAEGVLSLASNDRTHAEGSSTTASGFASHAEGEDTIASGYTAHAEGGNTRAGGGYSHAEGKDTIASGYRSHAEGNITIASGDTSHAEGSGSIAGGDSSHAEGSNTIASASQSHAEGSSTIASGTTSHAEGQNTIAGGPISHAEGASTQAYGFASHAEGSETIAFNLNSHVGGYSSITQSDYSFVHSNKSLVYGGSNTYILSGKENNVVNSDYSGIIGGRYNNIGIGQLGFSINAESSLIGGGVYNTLYEGVFNSTILGGRQNQIHKYSDNSSVIGGISNQISGVSINSGIFVGTGNTISELAINASIIAGRDNTISGHSNSVIVGGASNLIDFCLTDYYSAANEVIIGGGSNKIFGTFNCVIIGGGLNILDGRPAGIGSMDSFIIGSNASSAFTSNSSGILGGTLNSIKPSDCSYVSDSIIIGGNRNEYNPSNGPGTGSGERVTIIGGYQNKVTGPGVSDGSIFGGKDNLYDSSVGNGGNGNTIVGGSGNTMISQSTYFGQDMSYTSILGGAGNSISSGISPASVLQLSSYSNISGGFQNTITGSSYSFIGGGTGNVIEDAANDSVILGGKLNSISRGFANYATTISSAIIAGSGNTINGHFNSAILAGMGNTIHFDLNGTEGKNNETILGGAFNTISASTSSSIVGGTYNEIQNYTSSIILGGLRNRLLDFSYDTIYNSGTGGENTDENIVTNFNAIIGGVDNSMSGKTSHCAILGGSGNTINGHLASNTTYNSAIIGGRRNVINQYISRSVILGGSDITATTSDHVYVPNMIINTGGTTSKLGINTNSPAHTIDARGSNGIFHTNINGTNENSTVISGNTSSLTYLEAKTTNSSSIRFGVRGADIGSFVFDEYGKLNDSFLYSSINSNGLNIISADSLSGTEDYIRFYAGKNAESTNTPDIHIHGTGSTKGFVGFNTDNPTERIHVVSTSSSKIRLDADINNTDETATAAILLTQDGYGSTANIGISPDINNDLMIGVNSGGGTTPDIRFNTRSDGTVFTTSLDTKMILKNSGELGINTDTPSELFDVNGNGRFRSIGSSASAGALHYTSNGTLTTNTSDERLKTNIVTLTNALEKVKQLRGVKYNWTEEPNGDVRIGLIAQEVNNVVPELTFVNKNTEEQYMGVHYDNVVALLIEAVKELSTGATISNNSYLETQTILAEDNNIELNYNGTQETSLGGGLKVLHAKGQDLSAELITDENGDFVTNNDFKPNALTIPYYTPSSSNDIAGNEGNITRDDNYLYVKTSSGWKRTNLESF